MKQRTLVVKRGERVQIGLSSGYEPSVVANALLLMPLSVSVVKYDDEQATILVKAPNGIHADVLSDSASHLPYFADPNDSLYSRLYINRRAGQGVVFVGDSNTIIEDLEYSTMHKWIVKPCWTNNRQKEFELLIACYRTIRIIRGERSEYFSAYDPTLIPADMLALLSILEEPVPESNDKRIFFKNRVRNIRDLFAWYETKLLTDDIHEQIRVFLTRLDNLIEEIDESTWDADFNSHAMSQVQEALSREMGVKWTADFFSQLTLSNKPKNRTVPSNLDDLLNDYRHEEGYTELHHFLTTERLEDIPLHQCHCKEQPSCIETTVKTNDGVRHMTLVSCSHCGEKSKRHDWGIKSQVIAAWDKEHGSYQQGVFPDAYQFEALNKNEIHKRIKSVNMLKQDLEQRLKQMSPRLQQEYSELKTRLIAIGVWNAYIRNALKQEMLRDPQNRSM